MQATICSRDECGRPVGNPAYTIKDDPRRFCSQNCVDQIWSPERKSKRKTKSMPAAVCSFCHGPLPFAVYTTRGVNGKFCSNEHLEKFRKGERMEDEEVPESAEDEIEESTDEVEEEGEPESEEEPDPDTDPRPRSSNKKETAKMSTPAAAPAKKAPAKKAAAKAPAKAATKKPAAKAGKKTMTKDDIKFKGVNGDVFALMKDGKPHTMASVNKARGKSKANILWFLNQWGTKNKMFTITRDKEKETAILKWTSK